VNVRRVQGGRINDTVAFAHDTIIVSTRAAAVSSPVKFAKFLFFVSTHDDDGTAALLDNADGRNPLGNRVRLARICVR